MRRLMIIAALVSFMGALQGCGGSQRRASDVPAAGRAPVAVGQSGGPEQPLHKDASRPPDQATAALNSQLLKRATPVAADSDLPLGPGDLVEVSVFEVEELSKLKVRVSRRGIVNLPLLGSVTAAGRSPSQLEEEIRTRLQQRYIRDPHVSVFVHEHPSQRISIIGAIKKGGIQTMSGPMRLADALALAEGLTDDADHVVYVVRRVPAGTVAAATTGSARRNTTEAAKEPATEGTEELMVPIDLEALARGRDELNIALEPGDVIHVPRAGSFYVGGSVEKPGSFLLRGRTTVEQGILAAGGPKDVAALEDVRIYRGKPSGEQEIIEFNLNAFEKGQSGQSAPELQKNDVVIVGKSAGKAFWYGFLDFFKGVVGVSKGI
jgi:polysaccharide export outer membrane protein